jgi:hypothetical protein
MKSLDAKSNAIASGLILFAMVTCAPTANAQFYTGSSSSSSSSTGTRSGGYPIGTSTMDSPRSFGAPGLSPAPGVSSSTGIGLSPGQFYYYNNPGMGYYRMNQTNSQFPAYASPSALGGGYYQLGGLSGRMGYWRAPSGYYYPWCPTVYMPGVAYSQTPAIYALSQGNLAPVQPSVGSIISDMRNFIEDAKTKNQLDQSNYEDIFRRLNDITARSSEFSAKNGGLLNVSDERAIRRELDLLSADLARALNP